MAWFRAAPRHQPLVEDFIRGREQYCVSLSDKLSDPARNRLIIPARERASLFLERAKLLSPTIISLYYIERNGFSFIISQAAWRKREDTSLISMRRLIRPELKYLFSCMGRQADCDFFIRTFQIRPRIRLDYLMMHRSASASGISLQLQWEVRPGRADDYDRLLPLHLAYEQEEVALSEQTIDLSRSARKFKHIIEHQRVRFLEQQGQAVAKAQTNARGLTAEQIGGVYTRPEQRKRGLGAQLIEQLSREIIQDGKTVSLFVRRDNVAAIKLYEKCGFTVNCHFSIFYIW